MRGSGRAGLTILAIISMLAMSRSGADEPAPPAGAAAVIAAYNARDEGEHVRRIVTMTLRDKHGKERMRRALSCRKFYGTEKRTVFFFLEPASMRDTAFLTFDYAGSAQEDDQWLYLPATRKVRRINSGDRGDWFLGTDFTYEDIKKETKISAEDFSFRLIGTEMIDGHLCWKVEATALTPKLARDLGFVRAVHWVDKEILLVHKSEFFNRDGDCARTVVASDIVQLDGIWTVQRVTASNHRTGHTTEFRFTDIDYQAPVDNAMFTIQALTRGWNGH